MRLFLAIPLAAEAATQISALTGRLRRRDDGFRWTSPTSWHITLQFLGETGPTQSSCLATALDSVRAAPVPVQFESLACFERSGVFVLEIHSAPALLALQQLVVTATRPCGFLPENRSYRPHITLARARSAAHLAALRTRLQQPTSLPHFMASAFHLYESFLSPAGARYEVRRSFPLAAH